MKGSHTFLKRGGEESPSISDHAMGERRRARGGGELAGGGGGSIQGCRTPSSPFHTPSAFPRSKLTLPQKKRSRPASLSSRGAQGRTAPPPRFNPPSPSPRTARELRPPLPLVSKREPCAPRLHIPPLPGPPFPPPTPRARGSLSPLPLKRPTTTTTTPSPGFPRHLKPRWLYAPGDCGVPRAPSVSSRARSLSFSLRRCSGAREAGGCEHNRA